MEFRFTYLLMGLLFMVIWLFLFFLRKDNRKEMLIISVLAAIAGPIADILYTKDWWNPITLTGHKIGLESFFVGFMIGGIASVLYEDLFKKKVRIRKATKKQEAKKYVHLIFFFLLALTLFFGSFYLLNLNSLFATIIASLVPSIIIWAKRKDLILDSLFTGLILILVASIVYTILEFITPGWITAFWYFKNVPDLRILNLPLDDLIWYFFAGIFIGPFYEFWQEGKLVEKS